MNDKLEFQKQLGQSVTRRRNGKSLTVDKQGLIILGHLLYSNPIGII